MANDMQAHQVLASGTQPPLPISMEGLPPPDYEEIANRIKTGRIIPFFGAGASAACNLPSGRALAERLALKAEFPDKDDRDNLALVASYFVQRPQFDALTLKEELRNALDVPAMPGLFHHCFAKTSVQALKIFITTNYDDLIERALEPRAPWVVVDRGTPGVVWCRSPGGEWKEVEAKNLGYEIKDRARPIVLKLHGSLDRADRDNDSFLITEEDYVDFLGRSDGAQIPQMISAAMRGRSFLFLGYGLKDWNVRVLLRKFRNDEKIRSWAIVRNPGPVAQALWKAQNVELHDIDLCEFASNLEPYL